MRRAVRALRTTCQQTVRGLSRTHRRTNPLLQTAVASYRATSYGYQRRLLSSFSSPRKPRPFGPARPPANTNNKTTTTTTTTTNNNNNSSEVLQASMLYRRLSVALVSGLVGYGAYYAYQGESGAAGGQQVAPFSTTAAAAAAAAASASTDNAQTTRNVLVIGANELSTGVLTGDGPISKLAADDRGRRVVEMLTPDQATQRLRQNEESYAIHRGQGVVRYDLVQLPSNDPIEDDHAEKIVEVPATGEGNLSDWMFWGVFDGHAGWTTSAKLRQALIRYVASELNETYKAAPGTDGPPADAIEGAIKMGFLRLDDEIVNQSAQKVLGQSSKKVAAELLAPALSGSCALLSFYDSRSKLLRVACTGDSRAVLGRRSAKGTWTATPLSVDQTGSNPDEAARLRQQHPGEEHVVRNGRVLGGLEPTRAFGDASYKWTRDVAERLRSSFFGRTQPALLRTPPYVTAEPVVTTTRIEPEKGDFVVMATDGLWEMLTNEEAVGLVGQWLERQKELLKGGGGGSKLDKAWSKAFGSSSGTGLPVEAPSGASTHGERTPIRLRQWGVSPDTSGRFAVRDSNAATHLVRNALGGTNEEQVSALLTLPAPFSRRYRDDLTVQVIFFGEGSATGGGVAVNEEATGPGAAIKPKL